MPKRKQFTLAKIEKIVNGEINPEDFKYFNNLISSSFYQKDWTLKNMPLLKEKIERHIAPEMLKKYVILYGKDLNLLLRY